MHNVAFLSRRVVAFVGLLVSFFAPGCGEPVVTMHPGPRDVEVELGTGEDEFEPIEGEPTLPMAPGFQGGFHVWASVSARGFRDRELDVQFITSVVGIDGSRLKMNATLEGEQAEDEAGEPLWKYSGYPAQIKDAPCAHGRRVHLEVTVSDLDGHEAKDDRYCRVSLDQEYRALCD